MSEDSVTWIATWFEVFYVPQRSRDLVAQFTDDESGMCVGMFNVEDGRFAGDNMAAHDVASNAVAMLSARQRRDFRPVRVDVKRDYCENQ